jgi:Spy/CpxP family protein refolding chaperone
MMEQVLTEEQRASMREILSSQRDEMRELQEKIRDTRKALMKISFAEEFDEAAIRAKAMEVAKLEAEVTVLRARAMSKVQPPLSPKQIEQIINPPPMQRLENAPRGPRPDARPGNRPPRGPRDENDLPPRPKPAAQ